MISSKIKILIHTLETLVTILYSLYKQTNVTFNPKLRKQDQKISRYSNIHSK